MNSFESFIEIMKILNELAVAEDKVLLSSYSIDSETFDDNDKMKVIHDFVHKHFENKITLDNVASLVNMSNVTFNRFIKKEQEKHLSITLMKSV